MGAVETARLQSEKHVAAAAAASGTALTATTLAVERRGSGGAGGGYGGDVSSGGAAKSWGRSFKPSKAKKVAGLSHLPTNLQVRPRDHLPTNTNRESDPPTSNPHRPKPPVLSCLCVSRRERIDWVIDAVAWS